MGWVDSPVLTTITTTARDVTELDFPTITICREVFLLQLKRCDLFTSQGLNMEAVSRALEMDFTEWKLEKEEAGEEVSEEQYMEY